MEKGWKGLVNSENGTTTHKLGKGQQISKRN